MDDIVSLVKEIEEESESQILLKAKLLSKLDEQLDIEIEIIDFESKIALISNSSEMTASEIPHLLEQKNTHEKSIIKAQIEVIRLKDQLNLLKTESDDLVSDLATINQKKEELFHKINDLRQNVLLTRKAEFDLKKEREKNRKLMERLEEKQMIKKPLNDIYNALNTIELVISNRSSLKKYSSPLPEGVSAEVQEKIMFAKKSFDHALSAFSVHNVIPFCIGAQNAYKAIISVMIHLCPGLSLSLLTKGLPIQVIALVDNGLALNTHHLNAVQSMIDKYQDGKDVTPLASYSREVRKYFVENLTYLRIARQILLEL